MAAIVFPETDLTLPISMVMPLCVAIQIEPCIAIAMRPVLTMDVFVIVLPQESGDHISLGQPAAAPTDAHKFAPHTTPPGEATDHITVLPEAQQQSSLKMVSFGIASFCMLALGICCVCMARHQERKRVEAQKDVHLCQFTTI